MVAVSLPMALKDRIGDVASLKNVGMYENECMKCWNVWK